MTKNIALVAVDVQLGMFDGNKIPPVPGGERLIRKIAGLIGRARASGIPVIYIQHCGDGGHPLEPGTSGWQIHPAVAPLAGEIVVQKTTPDSFHQTELASLLEQRKIGRLVIAGLQTEYCVDTTCRRAFSLGYDVILVHDARGTWNAGGLTAEQIIAHHNNVLGNWFVKLMAADTIRFE